MADPSKIAILLKQVAMGVNAHDRENPDHHTWGIGMAHFDIERLGLEEGEELVPGIVLQADGGDTRPVPPPVGRAGDAQAPRGAARGAGPGAAGQAALLAPASGPDRGSRNRGS